MEKQDRNQAFRRLAAGITALLFALLLWGLWSSGFFDARTASDMRAYLRRFSSCSHLVFFLIQLASVILAPIPSNLTAAVGGLLFGVCSAFLLTTAAVLLGSVIVFQLARTLGRPFAERLISRGNWEKYAGPIRRRREAFLFLAFLLPFFPDDILCIMAGLTDIPLRTFLLLAVLGRPWGLLAACAFGGCTRAIPAWGMALLGLLGAAVFFLAMRHSGKLEDTILNRLRQET